MLMYLRCVDPTDKSMALGAGSSFINLVGEWARARREGRLSSVFFSSWRRFKFIPIHKSAAFIPYPLIYGYVLDKSCILWSETCDGRRGSCQLYDNDKMR